MIGFVLSNWKLVLIGLLTLALTGLFAAYQWRGSSLVASKATIEEQRVAIAGRDAQIEEQKKNLAAIKKHQARVQTITKEVEVVKEIIKEVPVVTFSGDCAKPEEERNHEAEKIKAAAADIVALFNSGGLHPKDTRPGDRGEVLSPTGKASVDGPTEPK